VVAAVEQAESRRSPYRDQVVTGLSDQVISDAVPVTSGRLDREPELITGLPEGATVQSGLRAAPVARYAPERQ